ncbi:hypothetical protein FRC08_017509 [Ceratobasidium sp. 394]|nr:hypothetical protein FRC08_017509 [Ceratobasidium sp. 394]
MGGGRGKNIGEEEEEEEIAKEDKELGGPEASAINPDDYEDDYAANASHHPANTHTSRARPQSAQPSGARPQTTVAEASRAPTREEKTVGDVVNWLVLSARSVCS